MNQIADFVADLIFKPGQSLTLVPVINISILLLLGVLYFLTYTTIDPIHIVVMATLSLGLLAAVNWVHFEVKKSASVESTTIGKKTD